MRLKMRLAIAFVTFSVLPIMFVGLMLSVGRLFMANRMDRFGPEVRTMVAQLMITAVLMLMFICGSLTIWVYRSILRPLSKLQEATRKIRDGNLDFTLDIEEDDEIEKYKLVTSIRGNSMENRISIDSPIGMALKGHKVGDRVEVKVNDNYSYFLEIRSIDKTHSEEEEIRGF